MKIEFQYFEGCPNSQKTLSNLKEVIMELGVKENNLEIVEVPDLEKAQEVNFQGSPTILINGKDIYTDKKPDSYNYTCRVYAIENERTGVLPIEFLRRRILTKF